MVFSFLLYCSFPVCARTSGRKSMDECLLVSYRPLAQITFFLQTFFRFVALRAALDQRGLLFWPLGLRFLSEPPRRAGNAREKPRFGQGFHTLRLATDAEPRPKTQAPEASRRQNP